MSVTAIPLKRALTTNSTSTGFSEKEPTATLPSGAGVFDLLDRSIGIGQGDKVPSYIMVIPFATDGSDDTSDFRLWGYKFVPASETVAGTAPLYIPILLSECSVVYGSTSGCDGAAIAASTVMADAITQDIGAADGAFSSVISPSGNSTANILIHTRGCRWIAFDWDLAGAQEAVSMNAFWAPVD